MGFEFGPIARSVISSPSRKQKISERNLDLPPVVLRDALAKEAKDEWHALQNRVSNFCDCGALSVKLWGDSGRICLDCFKSRHGVPG